MDGTSGWRSRKDCSLWKASCEHLCAVFSKRGAPGRHNKLVRKIRADAEWDGAFIWQYWNAAYPYNHQPSGAKLVVQTGIGSFARVSITVIDNRSGRGSLVSNPIPLHPAWRNTFELFASNLPWIIPIASAEQPILSASSPVRAPDPNSPFVEYSKH